MFKIYVGTLNYKTTDLVLRELFGKHFVVEDCVMATDPKTNESRGFAIVMTRDAVTGRAALNTMRGIRLDGRLLVINEAGAKKKDGPPGGSRGPRGPRSGPPSGVSHRPPGRSFRASSRPPGGGFRSGPPRRSHDDRSGGAGPGQTPPPPPSRG
jgi:transformer-2 protein